MKSVGIDIGSRTIKVALIQDNKIIFSKVIDNTFATIESCKELLKDLPYDKITATGYGRHLFADYFEAEVISEIKAFATGIHYLLPSARTILDIGGQDTKAISIDQKGKVRKFEMNDKCAAGTGRFLEIMAMALRFNLDEFGEKALSSKESANINSMCAVFAESEIISMLSKGEDRNSIAKGIHHSIIKKSTAILKRVGIESDLALAGGVAKNIAIKSLMETSFNQVILVPENPQIVGAIGCALNSSKTNIERKNSD